MSDRTRTGPPPFRVVVTREGGETEILGMFIKIGGSDDVCYWTSDGSYDWSPGDCCEIVTVTAAQLLGDTVTELVLSVGRLTARLTDDAETIGELADAVMRVEQRIIDLENHRTGKDTDQ